MTRLYLNELDFTQEVNYDAILVLNVPEDWAEDILLEKLNKLGVQGCVGYDYDADRTKFSVSEKMLVVRWEQL
jgi:hypothetical protein